MTFRESLKNAVRNPVSAALGAASAFGALLNPDVAIALGMTVYQTAPTLFTIGSLGAFTLPRVIPGAELLKPVFFVVLGVSGLLYGARLVLRAYNNFDKNL